MKKRIVLAPKPWGWTRLFAALALAGLAASPAQAQSGAAGVGTVEVVGQTLLDGVGVPLSEVPALVQSLHAADIAAQNPGNLADLLNQNLGALSVSNGTGNPYQNDVNYRGFQATSLLGAPVGLSVYLDGVRMNEPFGALVNWDLIPMNAVSSLHVLPGSNPMFGLNTLGGALVVNTQNGKDHPGTELTALGGAFGRRALRLETGGADAARGTDYFLAANWDRQNGYRDHSGSQVQQLYGKTRWEGEGKRTRLALSMALADSALSGTQALPEDMMGNPRAAYTWPDKARNHMGFLSLKGSHQIGDEQQLSGQIYHRQSRAHNFNSNAELDDGCSASSCANAAPNGTATNAVTNANALALGYGRWTSAINSSVVESSTRQNTTGAALQWAHLGDWLGKGNSFTLGASLAQSRIRYGQSSYLAQLVDYQTVVTPNLNYGFTANGLPPSLANLPSFGGSNLLRGVALDSTTRDLSLYFTDTLQLTRRLHLTASGSFNHSTIHQSGASDQYLNVDGGYKWTDDVSGVTYYNPAYLGSYKSNGLSSAIGVPAGAVAGPQTHSLDGAHRYHRFNPALGLNYQLNDSTGLFGSYSEALRAPTSVELSCANPQSPCALPTGFNGDPELQAVVAKTLELGGRGKLGAQASWTAAVYESHLSNDIQFIAAPNSTTYGYFANVGSTLRRGLDLGVQGRLQQLSVSAQLGLVDALYHSGFITNAGQTVVSGNRIPGIARSSLKLRASYAASPDWRVGASLIAVGGQYAHGNESNTDPQGKVAGYSTVHLDAQWQWAPGVKLFANVNNLLDKRYASYGLSGVTSIYTQVQQQFQTPAAPRSLWLGLSYSFGGKATKS